MIIEVKRDLVPAPCDCVEREKRETSCESAHYKVGKISYYKNGEEITEAEAQALHSGLVGE